MNTQPESLRLAHVADHPIPPDWIDMVAAVRELLRLHAENEALQQVYDARQLEIEQLEIEALRMRSAEPVGEYPAVTTEFINKHAHPSQAAKLCREDWSGKDESSVETVHPEVIKLLHAYVDADRAMRASRGQAPAPAVQQGDADVEGAIKSAFFRFFGAGAERDWHTEPGGWFIEGYRAAHPAAPVAQGDARAEQALLKVLTAVQRYLPPDGPSAKDTLAEIIGIIDPWPLGDQKGKA